LNFLADHRLETCDHIRIGMRAYNRTDNIVRIGRMVDPVAHRFVRGILQGHVAALCGDHRGAQYAHPFHVGALPFHIHFAHVDDAFHAHQRADGGCSNTVLPSTRFSDDLLIHETARKEYLSHDVDHLMSTGMTEVLAHEVNLRVDRFRKTLCEVQGCGSSYIVLQQCPEFFLESWIIPDVEITCS